MSKKKNKKASTIGEMTNSRGVWSRKPITQVVDNGKWKNKNDRKKVKENIKKGNYDY